MTQPLPLCVFSVQHTGTWFACEFLLSLKNSFGHEREHVFQWHKLENGEQRLPFAALNGRKPVIVSHLAGGADGPTDEHRGKHITIGLARNLAEYWPTVVPLRDPLLSLITRQLRHPERDHGYIIDAFCELWKLAGNVHWLPIDVGERPLDRKDRLVEITAKILGGWTRETEDFLTQWIAPAYNVTPPEHPLKLAYRTGDFGEIHAAFPEEFDLLLERRGEIRELLEPIGYQLPWWNL